MTIRRTQGQQRSANQPLAAIDAHASEHLFTCSSREEPWLLRDNVDMIRSSHYSAAPSGDLCTTLKRLFVVQGESRRSVPITGEKPQPFRPGRGAGGADILAADILAADILAADILAAHVPA